MDHTLAHRRTHDERDFHGLLERVGVRFRPGRRHDCPSCHHERCVSVDEQRGLYHCFGTVSNGNGHPRACDFSGNQRTLEKRIGIDGHKMTKQEYSAVLHERAKERELKRQYAQCMADLERLRGNMRGDPEHADWKSIPGMHVREEQLLARMDEIDRQLSEAR